MYGNYGIIKRLTGRELDPNELKFGLIDISLIPQLSHKLINYGLPNKPDNNNPFRYTKDETRWFDKPWLRRIAYLLGIGLQAIRFGMALLATVIALPVVALVHIIKFPYMYHQQQKLLSLKGNVCSVKDGQTILEMTDLRVFVTSTHSSLNDLCGLTTFDAQNDDITTYTSKNIKKSNYGSLVSRNPILFFRPSLSNSSSQKNAREVASKLEIYKKFDINDSEDVAIGKSFI